jgi:hypothetical protein
MPDPTVELADRHSRPKRLVMGLIGLFVLVWPIWDLWPGIASITVVSPIFWIIGFGSATLGAALLLAAIFGMSTVLTVAPSGLELLEENLVLSRKQTIALSDVGMVLLDEREWSDGPATFRVSLTRQGGKPFLSGAFATRGEAEALVDRLEQALHRLGRR